MGDLSEKRSMLSKKGAEIYKAGSAVSNSYAIGCPPVALWAHNNGTCCRKAQYEVSEGMTKESTFMSETGIV
jgi:hypothetical protein